MAHLFVIAGHGAGDPGATGNGYTEAERVRALAARLGALGSGNVTVADTSRDWYADNGISSLSIPGDWQIIELHMDSASASARGGHVIINAGFSPDVYDTALANFIGGILPGRANLIVGRADLANPARAAAKGYGYRLVECGFITNSEDVNIFNNQMDDLACGILSAFGIASTSPAGWVLDSKGWWYRNADGSWPKSCWKEIGGDWYYFGEDGYALHSGWFYGPDGAWYYLKDDCRMYTGWLGLDGRWFYLNTQDTTGHPKGSMMTGWIYVGNYWYYMNPQTDERGEQGSALTGFFDVGDYTYYCRPENDGHPQASMATGWQLIDGDWHYFNPNLNCQPVGSMMMNHWVEDGGRKYYLKDDGVMAASETLTISGKEYTFNGSGEMM